MRIDDRRRMAIRHNPEVVRVSPDYLQKSWSGPCFAAERTTGLPQKTAIFHSPAELVRGENGLSAGLPQKTSWSGSPPIGETVRRTTGLPMGFSRPKGRAA
jgi:hypothetical protein